MNFNSSRVECGIFWADQSTVFTDALAPGQAIISPGIDYVE